jgi:hypothetical protein
MASPGRPSTIAQPAAGLSSTWKLVISLLVSLHVFAVFVGPWAVPPRSELARSIADALSPYIQAARLDNGYRFFAPEPGPGHLVRYEVVTRDGQKIEGTFPDKKTERPRLLYHRYFMLSEFLNSISAPEPAKPATADSKLAELATAYAESYAGHLVDKYDAQSVKLYLQQHKLPTMEEVRAGKKLSDPEFYEEHLLVDYDREE